MHFYDIYFPQYPFPPKLVIPPCRREALCNLGTTASMHDASSCPHHMSITDSRSAVSSVWMARFCNNPLWRVDAQFMDYVTISALWRSKGNLIGWMIPKCLLPCCQVMSAWVAFILNIFLPGRRGLLMLMSSRYVRIRHKFAYEYYSSKSECFCHAKSTS